MILKEIQVGQSCQVIRIGQPEKWNKLTVTAIIEDGETMEQIAFDVMKRIENLHKELAPDAVEMFYNEPTIGVLDRIKRG